VRLNYTIPRGQDAECPLPSCPKALGEYNHVMDTIILHEGLKKYKRLHDAILHHEREYPASSGRTEAGSSGWR
jgi:hypothetical protein